MVGFSLSLFRDILSLRHQYVVALSPGPRMCSYSTKTNQTLGENPVISWAVVAWYRMASRDSTGQSS